MLGVVWVPRDGLFPLPVEENVISRLSGDARDGLFPLPVEEKLISGPTHEAQEWPVGCHLGPLRLPFSLCQSRKARDGLFLLPVKEKVLSRLAGWLAGWPAAPPQEARTDSSVSLRRRIWLSRAPASAWPAAPPPGSWNGFLRFL